LSVFSLRLRHFPSNGRFLIAPGFRPLLHPLTWFDGEGKNADFSLSTNDERHDWR
jgi:hypothetical protein